MNYYIFNIESEATGNDFQTIIFDFNNDKDYKSLRKELLQFYTYNYYADKVFFISPQSLNHWEKVKSILVELRVSDYYLVEYDSEGLLHLNDARGFIFKNVTETGLLKIFQNNNGLLSADDSYHFVLPSGKHSKYFLRVGNVLNHFAETTFIGFCLLSKLNSAESKKIYYDSSSILTVLISTLNLKSITSKNEQYELISFSSYENIENTDFEENSLVVISASNSGNLFLKIKSREPSLEIVTLFYNGSTNDCEYLINLYDRLDIKNKRQYKKHESCEYCNRDSIPVAISGEHFLPMSFAKEQVLITMDCCPKWIKDFLDDFAYNNVVKCNYNLNGSIQELFLDLADTNKSLSSCDKKEGSEQSNYEKEFQKKIKHIVPLSLKYIIYLGDKASENLASEIFNRAVCILGDKVEPPLSWASINLANLSQESCTTLIVTSAIATGNTLNLISKTLREFDKMSIIYFSGISRVSDKKILENITNNLGVRKDPYSDNQVHFLKTINLPYNHSKHSNEVHKSPWEIEKIKLINLRGSSIYEEHKEIIESRLEVLKTNGLTNQLFWPNPFRSSDNEQVLNKNFAFYRFEDNKSNKSDYSIPSQAEVYLVISSILNNLRTASDSVIKSKSPKKLVQHEHRRTLLSPENFVRFNDGIIQSSLLRAAKPAELNFSIDSKASHEIKELLKSFFSDAKSYAAESILEFLYAIWIEKLKMTGSDQREFIGFIKNKFNKVEEVDFFISVIEE
ncbi:hypothetical protein [Reichenbachiella agariperforans]|uniref:hypothetical protein n=1 Tax=Reichenbachiella agariperforans TaxID=156994 RepID=UPI001C08ADB8|nr:hypothetical protein [Reichenbachiella agariperforans]MBU2915965.1 hypothetical protein [Reichenbachiella agariperforans]